MIKNNAACFVVTAVTLCIQILNEGECREDERERDGGGRKGDREEERRKQKIGHSCEHNSENLQGE